MDLNTAISQLQQTAAYASPSRELKLVIPTFNPGCIGTSPHVAVRSLHAGFDWNAGLVMLTPTHQLTQLMPEQVADISTSVRTGQSWHAFQTYTKQADRIKLLEAELTACKARNAELEQGANTAISVNRSENSKNEKQPSS